jgi:hypothetical protein
VVVECVVFFLLAFCTHVGGVGVRSGDLANANARLQAAIVAFAPAATVSLYASVSVNDIRAAAEFALGPTPTAKPSPKPVDEEPTLIGVSTGGVVFGGVVAALVFVVLHRRAKKAKDRAKQAAATVSARKASIAPDPYIPQKRQSWVGVLPTEPELVQPRRQSVGAVNLDSTPVVAARRHSIGVGGGIPVTPDVNPVIIHRGSIVQATAAVNDRYSLQAQCDSSVATASQEHRHSVGTSQNPAYVTPQHRGSVVAQPSPMHQHALAARRQSLGGPLHSSHTPVQQRTSVIGQYGTSKPRRMSVGAAPLSSGGYPVQSLQIPLEIEVATRRGTFIAAPGVPALGPGGGYDSSSTIPFDPVPARRI